MRAAIDLKRNLLIIASVFCLVMLIPFFWSFSNSPKVYGRDEMIIEFNKNMDKFVAVADFLEKIKESNYINIQPTGWNGFEGLNYSDDKVFKLKINNRAAKSDTGYILNKLNFKYICKLSNDIIFETESKYSDENVKLVQGIFYSLDGEAPKMQGQKESVNLGDNWYYYLSE
jgi:hypothetical protein